MNEQLIEIVLALFWTGFVGLNLWLWRSVPKEEAPMEKTPMERAGIKESELNQGEPHATVHH